MEVKGKLPRLNGDGVADGNIVRTAAATEVRDQGMSSLARRHKRGGEFGN
jgi:hypothetical protein